MASSPAKTPSAKGTGTKAAAKSAPAKATAAKTTPAKAAPAPAKPVQQTRPSPEIRRVADLLKQVSDPTRLQVLMLLCEKERNVSELCADLGTQSQPAVSHHLALLRHGRLIEPRRSGKHNFYGLTEAGRELAEVVNSIVN
ncbi:ArsR/SmtB family transcription factor [Tundrisphaera sp. TA3]|uniref:ArsR/SmtB family transcription factor n=1 Tax=Tundrisphaera sp. TA3 TaxID=3435775 RepID=UPI003EB959E5